MHMLSDAAAIIVGFMAARLSNRMKTNKMSYGWQRAEVYTCPQTYNL